MNRYSDALAAVAHHLGAVRRGWCLVQCVAGEQGEVAACLAQLLGLPMAAISDDLEPFSGCVVQLLPQQAAATRDAALSSINGRRDRLSDRGRWILVASRSELAPLQRRAADIFSVLQAVEVVPLQPRQLTAEQAVAARSQLAAWYRQRFGKLDLRGFLRSETEDASFPVEDIFQPLEAKAQDDPWGQRPGGLPPADPELQREAPLRDLLLERAEGSSLILGGPGAGKSFFLRWCALQISAATAPESSAFAAVDALPVVISLAAVGLMPGLPGLEEYAVESLLAEGLAAGHLLTEAGRNGRALFLLDGLDEVGDVAARRRALAAVVTLSQRFPRARIFITSRPGGLEALEDAEVESLAAQVLTISPLSGPLMHAMLVSWCELYEWHRDGTAAGRRRGREQGEALARQVLASRPVRELASSPLLATVIAIVYRAGVRLPDRRVELYEHALKILVERWNAVRTRGGEVAVPLRLPDAVRLLGPVALEMIERDREGAIDEESLHGMLSRSLASGQVRGLTDAAATLELFRTSLGLLVERAPGVYGFLHQTFVEFLAAHELIRSGKLLALLKSPPRAYEPKWHEVVLLGAGILGILQANDETLGAAVHALIGSAQRRRGRPSSEVPRLLGELLADDPALSTEMAQRLIAELIPTWWFERRYGQSGTWQVLRDATSNMQRVALGPWRHLLRTRLHEVRRAFIARLFANQNIQPVLVMKILSAVAGEIAVFLCEAIWYVGSQGAEWKGLRILWYTTSLGASDSPARQDGNLWRFRAAVALSPGMQILWKHTWRSGLWQLSADPPSSHLDFVSFSFTSDKLQFEYTGDTPASAYSLAIVSGPLSDEQRGQVQTAYQEILAFSTSDRDP